ncbi:MAG: ABC transporter permease, partial [Pseudomonadota bacterium]|nr:ABC transporter permease [Pseudomonadota bacterium]
VTLGVALAMPLVMLFLFGYAISLDVREVRLGLIDQDRSAASRALRDDFTASGYFRLTDCCVDIAAAERALQRGEVKVVLFIPPRYQQRLLRQTARVQVLLDGTHSATALIAGSYATSIVAAVADPGSLAIQPEIRVWYNAPLKSVNYVVPGLYAVILMAFPPLLTALAIVREKESGAVQQVFASPVTPAEYIAAKLLPYGVIAFVQILMVMAAGYFWFQVPFRGSLALLLLPGFVYVLCTVGIGLLVSTVTNSQLIAMLLALIVTLMPSFLFSGFLFPVFTMPYLLQLYTHVFPTRYFVELSRGVVLKGAGPEEIVANLLILTAYTALVFLVAVARFRKKVA